MEKYDLENLSRVWKRVYSEDTCKIQETSPDKTKMLASFIASEIMSASMYRLLSLKTRGSRAENILKRIAADEVRHEKRLQAEYFLLRGDTCPRKPAHPSAPSVLKALKDCHAAEEKAAAAYEKAAKDEENGRLRAMFYDLARDERRHAKELRSLIEKFLA